MNHTYTLGITLAIASTFIYALMDSAIKLALKFFDIHYAVLYFHTTLIITSFLFLIGLAKFGKSLFYTTKPVAILLRAITTFCNFYLAFYILSILPLDIYYSIIFTAPIIASILAVFLLKEHFNKVKLASLALGLAGVLIITNPFSADYSSSYLIAILLTIVVALFISLSGIITRKYLSKENPIKISFFVFLICTFLSGFASFYSVGYQDSMFMDKNLYIYKIATAVSCLIGFFLFLKAYQITPIQLVAPTEYVLIVWGIIFGYFIFNEPTTITTIIGCLVVISSNILISLNSRNRKYK